eukprot:g3673.t1
MLDDTGVNNVVVSLFAPLSAEENRHADCVYGFDATRVLVVDEEATTRSGEDNEDKEISGRPDTAHSAASIALEPSFAEEASQTLLSTLKPIAGRRNIHFQVIGFEEMPIQGDDQDVNAWVGGAADNPRFPSDHPGVYMCTFCGQNDAYPIYLLPHRRNGHLGEKYVVKCGHCQKYSQYFWALIQA